LNCMGCVSKRPSSDVALHCDQMSLECWDPAKTRSSETIPPQSDPSSSKLMGVDDGVSCESELACGRGSDCGTLRGCHAWAEWLDSSLDILLPISFTVTSSLVVASCSLVVASNRVSNRCTASLTSASPCRASHNW